MSDSFIKSYEVFLFCSIFIATFFYINCEEIVLILFGIKWIQIADLLKIFAISLVFFPLLKINNEIIKVISDLRFIKKVWLFSTPFFIISYYYAASKFSLAGVTHFFSYSNLSIYNHIILRNKFIENINFLSFSKI